MTTGNIRRAFSYTTSITVGTSVVASTEIDLREYAGGGIVVPTGETVATLTYHVAAAPGGTYSPLYDRDGDAVTQAVAANRAYPLPDEVYGFGAVKIVGDVAGTVRLSVKG